MKIASVLLLLTCLAQAETKPAEWVTVGRDGKLVYTRDARSNCIPDFSNCGYHGGGVALPEDVAVQATVSPGADGDDGARIQSAIDSVGKMPLDAHGFRGAVSLKRGNYHIAGSIRIAHSGIVLRGEGQDEHGTVLIATGKDRRPLIQAGGGAHGDDGDDDEAVPAKKTVPAEKHVAGAKITDTYVPVGSRSFAVSDPSAFKVGDEIIIHRPSTQNWIAELGMDRIPPRKDGGKVVQWTAGSKDLSFDRIITSIDGSKITIDAPLTNALDATYGGGDARIFSGLPRARQIAVENLRGVSEYGGETDEEHSWSFISFAGVENGWVRDVTSLHFANNLVVLTGESKWTTVQDCTCLDPISKITGGRRYSFAMNRCQLCLVQRCNARNGRHDFVMGSLVAGPNVFLDCHAEKTHADSGPHHRWSVGTLYDGLVLPDGELNLRNRGNLGSGHGWAGANQVCWNCQLRLMIVEDPPTAQNWAIGCTVKEHRGNGIWESIDWPVLPASLYLAQLKERLGEKAVANIAKN